VQSSPSAGSQTPFGHEGAVVVVVELDPVILEVVVVELLVVLLVVDAVLLVDLSGAQRSFGAPGITMREPNWSFTMTGASAAFGHLSL